jgi:hypothetical protein
MISTMNADESGDYAVRCVTWTAQSALSSAFLMKAAIAQSGALPGLCNRHFHQPSWSKRI